MAQERTKAEELGAALKPRERQFVRELLKDLNGTRAAIRVGYSEKSAASQASRLLRKPEVKAYRDALLQEQFEALGITRHSIATEIWTLYQNCIAARPVMEWNSSTHEYEETGEWQFDSRGALKALEMLNRMMPQDGGGEDEDSFEDSLDTGDREY